MSKQLLFLCFSMAALLMVFPMAFASSVEKDPLIESDATPTKIQKSHYSPFYEGREEGWYWYKKEPVDPKKSKKDNKRFPDLSDYTPDQLWNMYPDDFNELQTRFLKKAVQNPTEQAVLDYMTLQNIARKKALAFANVESMTAQQHPELTISREYPVTAPGQTALVKMRLKEKESVITSNRDNFALILFAQEGCGFCEAQKSIMEYFINKYQWPVRDIDIRRNPNLAARFNVSTTPTILLVEKKTGKSIPIAVGALSLNDLENRLYRTIRYINGKITPQQWFMYNFEKDTSADAAYR